MTDPANKVEHFVGQALAGSLTGQLAVHRNLNIAALMQPGSPELLDLTQEIKDLGINPRLLANHALTAILAIFCKGENAETIITNLSSLLWTILGDPETGGAPPEIYRRAAMAMHLAFLGIIDPSINEVPTLRD